MVYSIKLARDRLQAFCTSELLRNCIRNRSARFATLLRVFCTLPTVDLHERASCSSANAPNSWVLLSGSKKSSLRLKFVLDSLYMRSRRGCKGKKCKETQFSVGTLKILMCSAVSIYLLNKRTDRPLKLTCMKYMSRHFKIHMCIKYKTQCEYATHTTK